MMILISGQPGNGKSLKAMALMLEEYERNQAAVKAGREQPRPFFTNMAGATREENPNAFDWVQKLPEHNDWRELPDGSYVVYDEAHSDGNTAGLERYGRLFPGTGKPGESDDPRIRAMSTHRHRGFDLVFVTQYPSKVHHNIRTLCGKHIHMNRALGMERAGVVTFSRVQSDPYDEKARDTAEEEIWAYPKVLYGTYNSTVLHTSAYKFRMPKKVWGALSMLIAGVLVMWGLWVFVFKPDPKEEPKAAAGIAQAPAGAGGLLPVPEKIQKTTAPGTGGFDALTAPPAPEIAGFIDSPRGCRVWGRDGKQIDMNQRDCRALVDQGMPVSFTHGATQAEPVAAGGATAGQPFNAVSMTAPQVGSYGDIGPRTEPHAQEPAKSMQAM